MGFDNESILNPETIQGGYYCPLCRQLVYPSEGQQAQCGHIFCKPCVSYVVGSTRCCPYDNHPVNEIDHKGLQEVNAPLYESLYRIAVRCVYHKSGCAWQGQLGESIAHSTSCPYGSSPVFCNRCGMQIMHRQVQEHAQTCTGVPVQQVVTQHANGPLQNMESNQLGQVAMQPFAAAQGQPGTGIQQLQQVSGTQVPQYPNTQEQPQPVAQQQLLQLPPDQWYYQQQYQQYYQQQYDQYQQYQQYDQQLQQQQQQQ
eukprot:c29443_g1_i1 orf=2-766(-)